MNLRGFSWKHQPYPLRVLAIINQHWISPYHGSVSRSINHGSRHHCLKWQEDGDPLFPMSIFDGDLIQHHTDQSRKIADIIDNISPSLHHLVRLKMEHISNRNPSCCWKCRPNATKEAEWFPENDPPTHWPLSWLTICSPTVWLEILLHWRPTTRPQVAKLWLLKHRLLRCEETTLWFKTYITNVYYVLYQYITQNVGLMYQHGNASYNCFQKVHGIPLCSTWRYKLLFCSRSCSFGVYHSLLLSMCRVCNS